MATHVHDAITGVQRKKMQLLRYAGSQATMGSFLFNGILKECYCIILGILCKRVLLPCYFVVVVVFGHLPWGKQNKDKTLILTI